MKKYFITIPLVLLFILASCGNPIIADEYGKVFGLGDDKLYHIKSVEDIPKLHAHPDGTFIFDMADEDIEMDAPVASVFTGKIQGPGTIQGMGRVLVNGTMFAETNGATIRDIIFVQNGSPERGATEIGIVTGTARNTQFINVRVTGSVPTNRTGGLDVYIGGIAGKMDAGSVITRSSSEASVGPAQGRLINIGGLVGFNEGGEISYSYSHGAISGSAEDTINAGGLAGINTGKIFDSYYALTGGISATGSVTFNLGGLAGESSAGTIENSYSSAGNSNQVTSFAGVEPTATALNAYHNKSSLPFIVTDFSSNPSYWSFGETFADGDAGGAPTQTVQILPRLINNPDRFTGSWK